METLTYPEIEMEPTVVEAPIEPETKSPLSPGDAIRLGRLEVPLKASGHLIVRKHDGTILAACALGAMWVGYEGADNIPDVKKAMWWPAHLDNKKVDSMPCGCAGQGGDGPYLKDTVAHINDFHIAVPKAQQTWNEEKLADWLDSVVKPTA